MPKGIVIEEWHITVLIPRNLPDSETDAIRRTLTDPTFEKRLKRAIRRVFYRETSLDKTKMRLSR